MKNTKEKGKFHFLIYGSKDKYTAICLELGLIEQATTLAQVKDRINNGARAIIETTIKQNLPLENLNQRPTFKYHVRFYLVPLYFSLINFLREFTLDKISKTPQQLCSNC